MRAVRERTTKERIRCRPVLATTSAPSATIMTNCLTSSTEENLLIGRVPRRSPTGFKIKELQMVGRAVYPGCRWWAGGLPPKRAMRCSSLQGRVNDALDLVPGCLYFRSVLLILSRLRLREYVPSIADKQTYGTICRMQRVNRAFRPSSVFCRPNLRRGPDRDPRTHKVLSLAGTATNLSRSGSDSDGLSIWSYSTAWSMGPPLSPARQGCAESRMSRLIRLPCGWRLAINGKGKSAGQ